MPRRGRGTKGPNKTIKVSGRSFAFASLSSGYSGVAVTPSGISVSRLTNIVKAYEYYRFTRLRFRLCPGCTSSVAFSLSAPRDWVACFTGEVPATGIAYSNALELTPVTHFSAAMYSSTIVGPVYPQTVPSDWAVVPRSQLMGKTPTRWWRTATGSTTDPDSVQGDITIFSDTTSDVGVFKLEIDYDVEFSSPDSGGLVLPTLTVPCGPHGSAVTDHRDPDGWDASVSSQQLASSDLRVPVVARQGPVRGIK